MKDLSNYLVFFVIVCLLAGCGGGKPATVPSQTPVVPPPPQSLAKDISIVLNEAIDEAMTSVKSNAIIALANIVAPNMEFIDYLTYELEHSLVRKRFSVVDRSELERIRAEQHFQISGEVDDATAVSIGKFAGADVIVIARATSEGNVNRLRLRILDTETARVIGTASELFSTHLSMRQGTIFTRPLLTPPPPPARPTPSVKVGEVITFGDFQWIVLEVQEDRALIISEKVIYNRQINATNTPTTWARCSLRNWLNSDFFNSFTSANREKIVTTEITTLNNPATNDRVFILSTQEAQRYFPTNAERVARDTNGTAVWWWLRTSGSSGNLASAVRASGDIVSAGYDVHLSGGVRPALWMSIE